MDDFAGIFTILIFLFYAAIAGAFIFAAIRCWVWPLVKRKPREKGISARDHRIRASDQEQRAHQP